MNRSEEHTSELQSLRHLVCRLLLEKKKKKINTNARIIYTVNEPYPHQNLTCSGSPRNYLHCLLSLSVCSYLSIIVFFFFFNDTATTEIYTLSLHDALPICLLAVWSSARTPRSSTWNRR